MNKVVYLINNRFLFDTSINELDDPDLQQKIRLEPRLTKLLCLLCENEGKLVSHDFLIKEIWDNYGGAGEGLFQAISFLRKVLKDQKKELIKTIPKKGYILNAAVSKDSQRPASNLVTLKPPVQNKTNLRRTGIFLRVAAACIIGFFVVTVPFRVDYLKVNGKKYKKELKGKIKGFVKGNKIDQLEQSA